MLRYAITDRARFAVDGPAQKAALLHQAARLAADGIDFIQLRERDLSAGELAELARKLLEVIRPPGSAPPGKPPSPSAPILLINSRADIAVAVRAGGVHLSSSPGALTPAQVRFLYAAANLPEPIVSLSCHTLAEVARTASSDPANRPTHILFGPVFEKIVSEKIVSKKVASAKVPTGNVALEINTAEETAVDDLPSGNSQAERRISTGLGLDHLCAVCLAAAPIPVLALGGVTAANAPDCLAAGADGVAAIRLFLH